MDNARLIDDLRRDEGVRVSAYQDANGFWTIGVGHLIDARRGGKISDAVIKIILTEDVSAALSDLDRNLPWWRTLSEARQRALVNVVFNVGIHGLLAFRKMLAALQASDFKTAAAECLDSDAARDAPNRYHRIAQLFLEG